MDCWSCWFDWKKLVLFAFNGGEGNPRPRPPSSFGGRNIFTDRHREREQQSKSTERVGRHQAKQKQWRPVKIKINKKIITGA